MLPDIYMNIHFFESENTYLKSNNYKELIGVRRRAFSENSLVIYDPPYIDGEGYNTEFTLEDHKNLIKTVVNSKADFIYFVRNRVSRSVSNDKDKSIKVINISPQKLKADDIILQISLESFSK